MKGPRIVIEIIAGISTWRTILLPLFVVLAVEIAFEIGIGITLDDVTFAFQRSRSVGHKVKFLLRNITTTKELSDGSPLRGRI